MELEKQKNKRALGRVGGSRVGGGIGYKMLTNRRSPAQMRPRCRLAELRLQSELQGLVTLFSGSQE